MFNIALAKELWEKYKNYGIVGLIIVIILLFFFFRPSPTPPPNGGGVVVKDTTSTQIVVTNNNVHIENHGKGKDIPKHHNSVVVIDGAGRPGRPTANTGGQWWSPQDTYVLDDSTTVTVKNWAFMLQGQLEAGVNTNWKPIIGARLKWFSFHGFGMGSGINSSGFTPLDFSYEVPKLSMLDITLGVNHTTFEVKKTWGAKASLAFNLW